MDQLPGSVPDLGNVREIWDTVPMAVPDLDAVWDIWDILTSMLIQDSQVETREKKVSLIEDLVLQGAESEMRLLDEKLQLVDAQRRLAQASSKRQALKLTKEQASALEQSLNKMKLLNIIQPTILA